MTLNSPPTEPGATTNQSDPIDACTFAIDKQSLSEETTDYSHLLNANGGLLSESNPDLHSGENIAPTNANLDNDLSSKRPLSSKSARQTTLAGTAPTKNGQQANLEGRQSKFDESSVGMAAENHQVTTVSSIVADSYDGSGTEPTPSPASATNSNAQGSRSTVNNNGAQIGTRQQSNGNPNSNSRRVVGSKHKTNEDTSLSINSDPMGESVDLVDDIHTTRSSLAGNNLNSNEQQTGNMYPGGLHGTISGAQMDQMNQMTPSLSLHAPYGSTSQPLNQLGHLLVHSASSSIKQLDPNGALLDSEDVLSSYPRLASGSSNSTLNDALMREYNLANSFFGNNSALLNSLIAQNQESESSSGFGGQQNAMPPGHHNRNFPASLPISVLLSDLIKLAGPHQNGEQPQQSINRPQPGILQQLRALPGPLLALLHSSSGGGGAGQPGNMHDLGGSGSHDTSESSQHYHRVSMAPTDIHSIIARSLKTTGILPAFPAPKGTVSAWIPPTLGGSYNPSINNNADFVASNTAGFLRSQQQQQQQADSSYQQQTQANSDQNYQRQSVDVPYYAPQPGDANQQQQQQNLVSNGVYQQSNSFENHQQQQQLQQKQDTYSNNNNPFVNLPPPNNVVQLNLNQQPQQQAQHMQHQQSAANQLGKLSNLQQPNQLQQGSFVQPQTYQANRSPQYSEIPVPLGYNPVHSQQQQHQALLAAGVGQQVNRNPFDYSPAPVESAPKVTIVSTNGKPMAMMPTQSNQQISIIKQNQQPIGQQILQQQQHQQKPHVRRKRSARESHKRKSFAAKADEDEDYLDSRPISVVHPDGRPMDDVRLRGFQSAYDGSVEESEQTRDKKAPSMGDGRVSSHSRRASRKNKGAKNGQQSSLASMYRENEGKEQSKSSSQSLKRYKDQDNSLSGSKKKKAKLSATKDSKETALDTAGSGLMSKLLGTANTNDESEEDMDDDDDSSANERRREEMDDAEFGISNDDRPGKMSSVSDNNQDSISPDSRMQSAGDSDRESGLGSGSPDNEAHTTRRNQQRSDIEFYGHPGEETRQLKYGILGSGNYEVVNGGVYRESDESTAAVNSVANYARKPNLLMSGFSKLMAAGGREQSMVHQADDFMPGGRVGGYLRGASAHPDDSIGLIPTHSGDPSAELGKGEVMPNPILELIDPMFNQNLLAQLGSSGTSARTTHASKDEDPSENNKESASEDDEGTRERTYEREKLHQIGRKLHLKKYQKEPTHKWPKDQDDTEQHHQDVLESHYSNHGRAPALLGDENSDDDSLGHSRKKLIRNNNNKSPPADQKSLQGSNQFNSYQISPSKKVTIYSDQDLDSAPSELPLIYTDRRPAGLHHI